MYQGVPVYKMPVFPFYSEDNAPPEGYFSMCLSLAAQDDEILVSGLGFPLLRVGLDGFRGHLGIQGEGPGEYGEKVLGIAVRDEKVWIFDDRKKAILYEDGAYIRDFRLQSPNRSLWPLKVGPTAHFDVHGGRIVFPLSLEGKVGQIATVYTETGEVIQAVEDPEFDEQLLFLSPLSQNTLWRYHAGYWYCLYQFKPEVMVFDVDFHIVNRFTFSSIEINEYLENFFEDDRQGLRNPKRNIPLFRSFQFFRGNMYLSGYRFLHVVDPTMGEVIGLMQFKVRDHSEIDPAVPFTSLPNVAILEDGTLVLNNPFIQGELFKTTLPRPFLQP